MGFPESQQFMSVKHIFENYQPSDHDRLNPQETDDELWKRKTAYAGVRGLTKDIKKNGIQVPISLGYELGSHKKPVIWGGHHRLAVAREMNPDMEVPVWTGIDDALHAQYEERQFKDGQSGKQGT
jgi:ParB-like chromosome segregation protein Spo0J